MYEEMRGHMLDGSMARGGGSFGLAAMLREGVTAWMHGVSFSSYSAREVLSSQQPAAPESDELGASIVAVLANMALSGHKEMRDER